MSMGAPKAGVMGWPVNHSLSPRLHGYWLKKYGVEGSYQALPVEPEKLDQALRGLAARGFSGVNLTIPHKEAALEIVDDVDTDAKRSGAINTVLVDEKGKLEGRNTDIFGFTQNLLAAGVAVKGKSVAIYGAGGAARAVAVALQDMGVSQIHIANRTRERAETLRSGLGGPIKIFPWSEDAMKDVSLLVNTTSLGMQGQPPFNVRIDQLPRDAAVADLVYVPLTTDLLQKARASGHKTVDGLGMLLHQARPAFKAFFGRDPEVTEELRKFVLERQ